MPRKRGGLDDYPPVTPPDKIPITSHHRTREMATPQYVTHPDPRALLAQAAAGFLAGRPDCLLVLRQGILRDDLHARAGHGRPATSPPSEAT